MNSIPVIAVLSLVVMCALAIPIDHQQLPPNVKKAEENFVNLLRPEQLSWWVKNRNQVLDELNATARLGKQRAVGDDVIEDIDDFIASLDSNQRDWWTDIRDGFWGGVASVAGAAGAASGWAALGLLGKK